MNNQDLLEKTKNLSSLLNNNFNSNNTNDIEKLLKIANSIKNLNEINTPPKENSNSISLTLENSNIKTIKSVLPFLDIEHKKNIGTFIEVLEMNHILNEYQTMKKNNNIEKNKLKKEALVTIKSKLNDDSKDLIDLLLKVLEINEIKNKISATRKE